MASVLPGVAYPGVRDNRSTINTKTGYEMNEMNSRFQSGYFDTQCISRHIQFSTFVFCNLYNTCHLLSADQWNTSPINPDVVNSILSRSLETPNVLLYVYQSKQENCERCDAHSEIAFLHKMYPTTASSSYYKKQTIITQLQWATQSHTRSGNDDQSIHQYKRRIHPPQTPIDGPDAAHNCSCFC